MFSFLQDSFIEWLGLQEFQRSYQKAFLLFQRASYEFQLASFI